jgi:hypothetical protein
MGFAVLIVCCCCFSLLVLIPENTSDYVFYGAAMLINFVQGLGGSTL